MFWVSRGLDFIRPVLREHSSTYNNYWGHCLVYTGNQDLPLHVGCQPRVPWLEGTDIRQLRLQNQNRNQADLVFIVEIIVLLYVELKIKLRYYLHEYAYSLLHPGQDWVSAVMFYAERSWKWKNRQELVLGWLCSRGWQTSPQTKSSLLSALTKFLLKHIQSQLFHISCGCVCRLCSPNRVVEPEVARPATSEIFTPALYKCGAKVGLQVFVWKITQ